MDALGGAPGVYSARYCGRHGDDEANNDKLLDAMQAVPAGQRGAKFVSAVCFILPDGRHLTCMGECPGSIAFERLCGDYGFGYDPLFIPADCGVGKTDKRPSFQRMMRDAEQHKFAYVLAWKSNRIGRNMMQALVNESRLVDCGVKVFYAEEDFDDNAAGRFALRSMMNVNQFYIENMAEDVKRGLYDNAKKGLVNGSLPLGYKRGADGKPELMSRKLPSSGRFIHESPPGSFLPA